MQNHNFAVDPSTLPEGVEVTHINLNDGTCAGLVAPASKAMTIQVCCRPGSAEDEDGWGNPALLSSALPATRLLSGGAVCTWPGRQASVQVLGLCSAIPGLAWPGGGACTAGLTPVATNTSTGSTRRQLMPRQLVVPGWAHQ